MPVLLTRSRPLIPRALTGFVGSVFTQGRIQCHGWRRQLALEDLPHHLLWQLAYQRAREIVQLVVLRAALLNLAHDHQFCHFLTQRGSYQRERPIVGGHRLFRFKKSLYFRVHLGKGFHHLRVALTELPVERVLPERLSKAYWDIPLVVVGAIDTAEDVSGEFLGRLVSDGCFLCRLIITSQGIEALRG